MVSVHITDTSAVSVGGQTITGPATFDASSATVAGSTYGRGVIVVTSGSAIQTAERHPVEEAVMPPAIVITFILGLLWARAAS